MSSDGLASSGSATIYPAWYDGTLNDWPWYEVALAAIIMTTTVVFTSSCASHIAAGWILRRDFSIAARSPLLLSLSGSVGALLCLVWISRYILFPAQVAKVLEGSDLEIVLLPLSTTGNTAVYGLRGLRLLMMYDSDLRRRWGRVPDERALAKYLVVTFLVVEAMAWSTRLVNGDRIRSMIFGVIVLDMLLTVGICSVLVGKLRKVNDIFCVSAEVQKVGAFALVVLAFSIFTSSIPAALQRYWMLMTTASRFVLPLCVSNITPIRILLEETDDYHRSGIFSLFPYVPWGARSKVAIEGGCDTPGPAWARASQKTSFKCNSDLGRILNFPPLLEAFGDFCQRALCSESLGFLVAVKDFVAALNTSTETDGNREFDTFMEIVDKFVTCNSPCEVNIDSKTRDDILAKAATFKGLSLDDKVHALEAAEKEIGKMLEENLLQKFQKTEKYKEITGMLLSITASNISA